MGQENVQQNIPNKRVIRNITGYRYASGGFITANDLIINHLKLKAKKGHSWHSSLFGAENKEQLARMLFQRYLVIAVEMVFKLEQDVIICDDPSYLIKLTWRKLPDKFFLNRYKSNSYFNELDLDACGYQARVPELVIIDKRGEKLRAIRRELFMIKRRKKLVELHNDPNTIWPCAVYGKQGSLTPKDIMKATFGDKKYNPINKRTLMSCFTEAMHNMAFLLDKGLPVKFTKPLNIVFDYYRFDYNSLLDIYPRVRGWKRYIQRCKENNRTRSRKACPST